MIFWLTMTRGSMREERREKREERRGNICLNISINVYSFWNDRNMRKWRNDKPIFSLLYCLMSEDHSVLEGREKRILLVIMKKCEMKREEEIFWPITVAGGEIWRNRSGRESQYMTVYHREKAD